MLIDKNSITVKSNKAMTEDMITKIADIVLEKMEDTVDAIIAETKKLGLTLDVEVE
jgi:hypothetical protein